MRVRLGVRALRTRLGPGLAEVEDGLGGGEVLHVPVLQEGGTEGGKGGIAGLLVLVLHRILQTVRSEQAGLLGLHLRTFLGPFAGEILGLLQIPRMQKVVVVVVGMVVEIILVIL